MENIDYFILDLALITVVASAVTLIFRKIKVPVVLGYIIAGFFISPNFVWLPTVVEIDNIDTWANIGIVFLMFGLGLEFSFRKIATVGVSAFVTALTVMGAMVFIGTLAGHLMGWAKMDCIFLGGMISISSTMIIMKSYEQYRLRKEKFSDLILGTMVVEDIVAIFMIIILTAISVGRGTTGLDCLSQIGTLMLFLVVWLVLGVYLIPTFLKKTKKLMNDEVLLIMAIAICFIMVVISVLIGFSEALGAFMAGSILAGTVSGEKIHRLIKPIKDLFGAVFFVSVGMMVEPPLLVKYIVPILIITFLTIAGQMIFSTIGILLSGNDLHTAVRGGSSMVQIGEFSFIIAALGKSLGVTSDFLYPIIVCVAVLTISITPFFIKHSEKAYIFIFPKIPKRVKAFLRKYTSEKEESSGRDRDWKLFLSRYFSRVLVCIAVLFIEYITAVKWIEPFLALYTPVYSRIFAALATSMIMIPVISVLWSRRGHLYEKLWLKNKANRLPLIMLHTTRIIISVFFIVLTLREFLDLPYIILLAAAIIIVALTIRSDFMRGQAIKTEARIIANFNEKLLHRLKEERGEKDDGSWLDDKLFVVGFEITSTKSCRILDELYDSRLFDVVVFKIIRKGRHINLPMPDYNLAEGDILHAISSRTQLEAFIIHLEETEHIKEPEDPMVTLKEYVYGQTFDRVNPEDQIICCAVQIKKDSCFVRKSIMRSGFRRAYKGFIVAIERGNLPIIDPNIRTVIEEGDILWIMGTKETADMLLADGLMEEG